MGINTYISKKGINFYCGIAFFSHRLHFWERNISHPLFITIFCSRCSLRFPDIREKDRVFGMAKINRKLKNQGVRNESSSEDRNEHRQLLF